MTVAIRPRSQSDYKQPIKKINVILDCYLVTLEFHQIIVLTVGNNETRYLNSFVVNVPYLEFTFSHLLYILRYIKSIDL